MTAHARIGDYPSKPAVRRAVTQAGELGFEVAGYEIAPGGVIRVLFTAAFAGAQTGAGNDFDRWIAQEQDKGRERHPPRP